MKKLWVLLLSACLGLGTLVAQDINTLMKRAQKGDASAQCSIGVAYTNGQGVPQDYARAVKWLRLAADQGVAIAQYSLGLAYASGRGVTQDYAEAMKWYRLAADQGVTDAQCLLGVMYSTGEGVPKDDAQAHMWFNLAAAQGNENGKKGRDLVEQMMTPQQIAQAQELARNWKSKKK